MKTPTPTPAQAVVLEALRLARQRFFEVDQAYILGPRHGGIYIFSMREAAWKGLSDAIDAALVQPPEAPAAVEVSRLAEDEHGWLIECDGKWPYLGSVAPLSWLTVRGKLSGYGEQEFYTTHDASQALRFSRREDAEAILRMHLGGHDRPEMRAGFTITEHMWALATMASTPAPQVPSEAARLVGGEAAIRAAAGNALDVFQTICNYADSADLGPTVIEEIGGVCDEIRAALALGQAAPTDAPGEQK